MPNSDFAPFTFTDVNNASDTPTTMYTQKRVNQFVSDYASYKNTSLKGTTEDPQLFSYYHFVPCPEAIVATNLGSLVSTNALSEDKKSCLLQPYVPSTSTAAATGVNTPMAHQMNLLKDYLTYLSTKDEGNNYVMLYDDSKNLEFSRINLDDAIMSKLSAAPSDYDGFVDNFKMKTAFLPTATTSYGVEAFMYVKCPTMGKYTFTFTPDDINDKKTAFLIWIGDVSLLEYYEKNADMNTTRDKVDITVASERKLPVRVQYFYTARKALQDAKTPQDVINLLKIQTEDGININRPDNLYITGPLAKSSFIYPPLYAAFTSQTQNSYMLGQFQCYSNLSSILGTDDNLLKFYDVVFANRRDMFKGTYDRDKDGTPEVGKLDSRQISNKTPTFYSQENPANTLNLPNVFSIYRFSVDNRFDNTYQITTKKMESGQHLMTPVSDTLLKYGSSYTDFAGYFPFDSTAPVKPLTPELCKQACNDIPTCGHFFSYRTTGGNPQCVLGTGATPVYNQVRFSATTDEKSGNLALRNKELKEPPPKNSACVGDVFNPTVKSTIDYTLNFPYGNYDISGATIASNAAVGVCGQSNHLKFVKEAQDILYKTRTYRDDGTWEEGMRTKDTTAVDDTASSIASNLSNHDLLRQRLMNVNNNDQQLRNTITAYQTLSRNMTADNRYDHKGNMLMYNKSPLPSLTRLNSDDSQLLSNQQTILFYTGIVTAATLLVLAVTMGND